MMTLTQPPTIKAELLIRKLVATVFNAFVDPDVVTQFWFNRSSGRLENGKTVQWHWDICPEPAEVRVKAPGLDGPDQNFDSYFFQRPEDITLIFKKHCGVNGEPKDYPLITLTLRKSEFSHIINSAKEAMQKNSI